MRLVPIPKWLMSDQLTVYPPADGEYGGEFGEPVHMSPVLYVEKSNLLRSGYVLESGSTGMVFIDAENTGNAAPVAVGSLCVINGEELFCKSCAPQKTGDRIHHWEVEVG